MEIRTFVFLVSFVVKKLWKTKSSPTAGKPSLKA